MTTSYWSILKNHIYSIVVIAACAYLVSLITWSSERYSGSGDAIYVGPSLLRNAIPFPPYWNNSADGGSSAFIALLVSAMAVATYVTNSLQPIYIFLFGLSPLVTGGVCVYPLAFAITRSRIGSLIASLMFSWNTYSIVGVHGGQAIQSNALVLTALVYLGMYKSFESVSWRVYVWATSFAFALQAAFDPRFAYMCFLTLFVVFFMQAVTNSQSVTWVRFAVVLCCMVISAAVLQAPWLFGLVVGNNQSILPSAYTSVAALESLSWARLSHVMSMMHPYFPITILWSDESNLIWLRNFDIVGLLIIFGMWRGRGELRIIQVATAFILTSFLSKGINAPSSDVNVWVFEHVPGMFMFRDPVKWMGLSMLFGSLLVGVSVRELWNFINKLKSPGITARVLTVSGMLFIALAVPLSPFVQRSSALRVGLLAPRVMAPEDVRFNQEVERKQVALRVLVVPSGLESFDLSSETDMWSLLPAVDSYWRSFVPGVVDAESGSKLLGSILFKTILRVSNIHYIVVPPDYGGWVFGRDRRGGLDGGVGFDQTVEMVARTTGFARNESYADRAVFEVPDPLGPVFVVDRLRGGLGDEVLRVGGEAAVEWGGGVVGGEELLLALPSDIGHGDGVGLRRVSGSRYVARLGKEGGGWVVLSEAYAAGWRAYVVPDTEPAPALVGAYEAAPWWRGAWWWMWPGAAARLGRWELGEHVKVNGFMQAWRVPVRAPEAGGQWLVVEYYPQRAYEAGWLVTLTAGAVVAGIGVVTAGRWCIVGVGAARSGSVRLGAWVRRR